MTMYKKDSVEHLALDESQTQWKHSRPFLQEHEHVVHSTYDFAGAILIHTSFLFVCLLVLFFQDRLSV